MQTIRVGIIKIIDERERSETVLQQDEVIANCK